MSDPTNALEMSDEDFANVVLEEPTEEVVEEEVVETVEEDTEEVEEEGEGEPDTDDDVDNADSDTDDTDSDSTEAVEETEEETVDEVDYAAEYNKLLAPFKANGKEIKIDNVDDAVALMQMGANYNKKMAGLKPNLKLIKMLENNGLLDESKLNYLIDLDKKDPGAVNKLIKDSGIDPLDIDTDKPSEYTPNTYNASDNEVELDGVLDEIKDTKSFNETVDIISTKLDNSSKQVLLDNPSIIKIINEQVESGIYQQITSVIEAERMLGRLTGLNDLEAYKQVGEQINATGGFTANKPTGSTSSDPIANAVKKAVDPKLKNRKKATSSTKSVASKKTEQAFNPLSMSDEEFEKIASSKYM